MRELDFLFVYEHKVRELENLCLIKYELDRRGYKTEIRYIEVAENELAVKPFIYTKVLLVMSCYDNHALEWQIKDYVKFDKVIDMQWENIVYPKDEEREDAFKNYKEIGKGVPHVSWGQQNVKRLLKAAHLDQKMVKLVGHVGMDFLREPLCRYYLSREELFQKYDLSAENKTIFFASPYYGDSLPQEYIADMCARFGENWTEYYKFMCDSQHIVLKWFENICAENPDIQVVFRPHPGHPSLMVQKVAERCSNFHIIAGESVKQWIVTCDKIYTGNSSVVVEAFFARKMCQLLFPLPVTDGFELKLISDSRRLTDYEQLRKSVLAAVEEFPTPQSSIEEIYLIDWNTPSYIKFADMAEEVLKDDSYKLTAKQIKEIHNYSTSVRVQKAICRIDFLYRIYLKMISNEKLQWGFLVRQRQLREKAYITEKEHAHELTTDQEMEEIIGRIAKALESRKLLID